MGSRLCYAYVSRRSCYRFQGADNCPRYYGHADSLTKYFLGHSDALAGSLSVRSDAEWMKLWHNRTYTGSNAGSLESWLLLRSIRSMHVRVTRQFTTATKLARWLDSLIGKSDEEGGIITKVWHASLQEDAADFIGEGKQMSTGSACFLFEMKEKVYAEHLGNELKLFTVRRFAVGYLLRCEELTWRIARPHAHSTRRPSAVSSRSSSNVYWQILQQMRD